MADLWPGARIVRTGEIAGAAAATVMPSVACRAVRFKAQAANAGNVYIGLAGVTAPDGATDTSTGWELDAGEETPWLPIRDNMTELFRICENAGDDLTYIAVA